MAVIAGKIQFQENCIESHLLECFASKLQQDTKCAEKGKKHKTQEKCDVVNFFVVYTIVRSSLLCYQSPSIANSQVYVSERNHTIHKRPNIHLIEQVLWATDIPHEVISTILCTSFCRFFIYQVLFAIWTVHFLVTPFQLFPGVHDSVFKWTIFFEMSHFKEL